mgnify:FL=1
MGPTVSTTAKYTYAAWYIPKPLYDALTTLQEGLKGPDGTLKWATVEGLAVHFLGVAVQAARKELEQKVAQSRLVQPAAAVPPMIVRGR